MEALVPNSFFLRTVGGRKPHKCICRGGSIINNANSVASSAAYKQECAHQCAGALACKATGDRVYSAELFVLRDFLRDCWRIPRYMKAGLLPVAISMHFFPIWSKAHEVITTARNCQVLLARPRNKEPRRSNKAMIIAVSEAQVIVDLYSLDNPIWDEVSALKDYRVIHKFRNNIKLF
ncbi:hypothetical protein AAVH_26195 [Aphelenchoides avenae]|nr:hypothetical protein AAVH_26195 [Aphelenchus avenae]